MARSILPSLFAFGLASAIVGACANPTALPLGIGPDYGDGGDEDGDDGAGAAAPSSGYSSAGSGAQSCDDPATCDYDLHTTCAGKPALDPSLFPECPTALCGAAGRCVPDQAIPSDQSGMLASCDATSSCVPVDFVKTGGRFTAKSCESIAGVEGRCLSTCLPSVSAQSDLLPAADCASGELCVPCFDPFDGLDTGACGVSCDAGPAQPKEVLPSCCADKGGGTCVPNALVTQDQVDQLDADECAAAGLADAVCVPTQILNAHLVGVPFNPVECETGLLIQQLGLGSEGGCLPECIPIVDSIPVSQSNCAGGFKCVPCIDLDGDGTGACSPQ